MNVFILGKGEKPDFLERDDEDTSIRKRGKQLSAGSKSRLPLKSKKRQMKVLLRSHAEDGICYIFFRISPMALEERRKVQRTTLQNLLQI